MSKCLNKEQAIDYIVKEFKLLPYQEYILRKMSTNKYCIIPPMRSRVNTNNLLVMANLVTKRGDKAEL